MRSVSRESETFEGNGRDLKSWWKSVDLSLDGSLWTRIAIPYWGNDRSRCGRIVLIRSLGAGICESPLLTHPLLLSRGH